MVISFSSITKDLNIGLVKKEEIPMEFTKITKLGTMYEIYVIGIHYFQ